MKAVQKLDEIDGVIDWEAVSQEVNGHMGENKSQIDCYIQYTNVDSSDINTDPWNSGEDERLRKVVGDFRESDWLGIAREVGNRRTPWQCLQRYQQFLNPSIVNHSEWTEEEDLLLRDSYHRHGGKDWQAISAPLPGRSVLQCQLRWRRSMVCNDTLIEGKWSSEDERKLLLAALVYDLPVDISSKKSPDEILALKRALLPGKEDSDVGSLDALMQLEELLTDKRSNRSGGNKRKEDQGNKIDAKNQFKWVDVARLVPGK